jgi:hypothetical protein
MRLVLRGPAGVARRFSCRPCGERCNGDVVGGPLARTKGTQCLHVRRGTTLPVSPTIPGRAGRSGRPVTWLRSPGRSVDDGMRAVAVEVRRPHRAGRCPGSVPRRGPRSSQRPRNRGGLRQFRRGFVVGREVGWRRCRRKSDAGGGSGTSAGRQRLRVGIGRVPVTRPGRVRPARVRPARVRPARVRPARVRPARVRPARVRPARVIRMPEVPPPATAARPLVAVVQPMIRRIRRSPTVRSIRKRRRR